MTEKEALQESYWINREIQLLSEIQGLHQEAEILRLEKALHLDLLTRAEKIFSSLGTSVISRQTSDTFSEYFRKMDRGHLEKTLSGIRRNELLQFLNWCQEEPRNKSENLQRYVRVAIQEYCRQRFHPPV